jgi:gamma-glutamyl-gamma-aminobutyrate hydrolase PuuD
MHNNSADGLQPPLILVVMKRKMDFNEINKWPKSWAGTDKDIEYGRKIMQLMKLFIIELLDSSYSPKTVKEHIDNLWLLGGHIIKHINYHEEKREKDPLLLLTRFIDSFDGPHISVLSENEQNRNDVLVSRLHY